MADLLPVLLVLALVGLLVAAAFDCATTDRRFMRLLPKPAWLLFILLVPGAGAITWFARGHASAAEAAYASGHPAGRALMEQWAYRAAEAEPPQPQPRTVPPDDDPDFLADLATRAAAMRAAAEPAATRSDPRSDEIRSTEERLRRWEADLRQREERLRQRGEPPIEG